MTNDEIIVDLVYFFAVAIIFLIAIMITFKVFVKHFKFNEKNLN